MSDYEEDSIDIQKSSKNHQLNHWLEDVVQSPQTNGQLPLELL